MTNTCEKRSRLSPAPERLRPERNSINLASCTDLHFHSPLQTPIRKTVPSRAREARPSKLADRTTQQQRLINRAALAAPNAIRPSPDLLHQLTQAVHLFLPCELRVSRLSLFGYSAKPVRGHALPTLFFLRVR